MKRLFATLSLLCCCASVSWAQSDEIKRVESDSVTIRELTARVEKLEKRSERWDKVLSRLPKVSGYLQAGYQGASGSSSFFVKSARVWAIGDLAPKLDYMLQMELVSPRLLDAFIRYRPFTALGIQLGEFKIPFTIENTDYTPLNFELIECPLVVYKLVGFTDVCGINATGREVGVKLSGEFLRCKERNLLRYDVGVFNGEGINVWDKNKSKDVVGRLTLLPVRGLMLSGYYYWGEYGPNHLKRIRYGGGAAFDRGLGVLRGEYIAGVTGFGQENGAGELVSRHNIESEGWYLLGGIRPVKKLMIAARYDTYVENRSVGDTRQTNYTAGITWEPIRYLRCQLNYTYEDFAAVGRENRNVVTVMFMGIF